VDDKGGFTSSRRRHKYRSDTKKWLMKHDSGTVDIRKSVLFYFDFGGLRPARAPAPPPLAPLIILNLWCAYRGQMEILWLETAAFHLPKDYYYYYIYIYIFLLLSPLRAVFTIIYLKQAIFLRYTVLQLFCIIYNLCYMQCYFACETCSVLLHH